MEYGLEVLKINKNRIQLLNQMSLFTVKDLIQHYPYRYDEIIETPLHDEQKVIIEAILVDEPKVFFKGKLSRLSFHCDYQGKIISVIIFNRHFLKKNMKIGLPMTIIGKYNQKRSSITASDIKLKSIKELEGITPIYSLKEGITQKSFQGYVKKALDFYKGHIGHIIPDFLCEKYHLITREEALFKVHFPQVRSDVISSLRYLKYEEFFKFQLTMQYIKMNRTQNVGISKLIDKEKVDQFIQKLPFSLTEDQQNVVEDILLDLSSHKLMYRFVQGDVGSGKTVVAAISLYANYLAGYQGAMMAPTEILAMQHYQSLSKLFKKTGIKVVLLTGRLSVKEKREIYQQIENGKVDIVVGTHALFQDKLNYHRLGLVITDEQHRFGVEQRKALKDKGEKVDFLIMTATPIPRTLAISLFGDMDVSTITTLPSGRKDVKTKFIKSTSMKPILNDLKNYLASGGQCYVVCPLVNESEAITGRNAVDISKAMASYFKEQYRVGLIHGQMSDEELFIRLLCSLYHMAYQYGSRYASHTARNGGDGVYDGLYLCVIHISAELSFRVYIDAYIDDDLARSYVGVIYDACAACGYDYDVSLFYHGGHINRPGVAYSHGSVFLDQHHGCRFPDYQGTAYHNGLFACAVDAVVIQNLHASLGRTGRVAQILSGKYACHGTVCHAVYILRRIQSLLNLILVQVLRQRTEQKNAVNRVILVHLVDHCQYLFLCCVSGKNVLFALYAQLFAALRCASLVGEIALIFTNTDDAKCRYDAFFS